MIDQEELVNTIYMVMLPAIVIYSSICATRSGEDILFVVSLVLILLHGHCVYRLFKKEGIK